jgi:hypothetical protein
MEHETMPLATELLKEIQISAKRWFIIAIVELLIILSMAGGFVWYLSLPIDEVVVENDDGNATYVGNDLTGAIYNGKDNSEEAASTAP